VIKKTTEIKLHHNNFNRDSGFTLSQSWYPVINILKQYRDTPNQKQGHAKQALGSAHQPLIGSRSELNMVSWEVWEVYIYICGMVWMYSHTITLMMGTDMVPETLVFITN
jgi:hypothetical protein